MVNWNADTVKQYKYVPRPSSNTLPCALVMLKSRETLLEVVLQHKIDALAISLCIKMCMTNTLHQGRNT